jgi:hypothetical protein
MSDERLEMADDGGSHDDECRRQGVKHIPCASHADPPVELYCSRFFCFRKIEQHRLSLDAHFMDTLRGPQRPS